MIGKRIREARKAIGMTQAELGAAIGIGKSSVSEWESGKRSPDIDKISDIASALHTTVTYLLDWTHDSPDNNEEAIVGTSIGNNSYSIDTRNVQASLVEDKGLRQEEHGRDVFTYKGILPVQPWRIPLLGSVAAGEPIYDPEDFDVSIPIGAAVRCDFALRIKGDSMIPTYKDGDIVLVRKQQVIEDGRIAVVVVGEEVTLKHVYRTRNGVTLVSENPEYPPMPYIEDECDQIRIIGKPVAYLRGV